uniref:Reverse transcriptase domain-containing protein n=1 Tax=Tanacetum cinerariifolium TaxID=118510 RepID=A0A6L2MZ46_TANCI|nr:hypothetical protein [Tanacetum cinerariifolium]
MFAEEQPPDYLFLPRFDVYPDDFLEIEFDATFDDDCFDSEGEKIKEAELLIDQLDLPCDILSEYDSFNSQDFSRDDVLFSPDNEDKVRKNQLKSLLVLLKKRSLQFLLLLGCLRILILHSLNFLFSKNTTTHPDISLPKYEAFYDDHVKEISSGSLATHSDSSLYASFIFDPSINPFPPADRSDFYVFFDELIPFISPPEYDCFFFKVEPNSRDFTKDVVEDISPTKEP